MSNETVGEAHCVLCRHLDPGQRAAMRADLLEIPLHEAVCDQCLEAFTANLFASFPKTEEERLRRRAEFAASGMPTTKTKQEGMCSGMVMATRFDNPIEPRQDGAGQSESQDGCRGHRRGPAA